MFPLVTSKQLMERDKGKRAHWKIRHQLQDPGWKCQSLAATLLLTASWKCLSTPSFWMYIFLEKRLNSKSWVVFHGTSERKATNIFIRPTLSLSTLVPFTHLLSHTNIFNGPLPCAKCSTLHTFSHENKLKPITAQILQPTGRVTETRYKHTSYVITFQKEGSKENEIRFQSGWWMPPTVLESSRGPPQGLVGKRKPCKDGRKVTPS